MPAIDYVSIIRSVYGARRTMLAGSFASGFAAFLTAYNAQSDLLSWVGVLFVVLGIVRYYNMRAFWQADIGNEDAAAAERWENRAVVIGALLAFLNGTWCLIAMLWVQEPFAELASFSLTMAVMVGLCARNFGLDRLVTIQLIMVILPLSLGLLLRADIYHPLLALLLFVMLSSFRSLAAGIRSILLSAVHGRVEASRLAAELDMAITTLQHGLCLLDENAAISVANERARRLFRALGVTELVGRPLNDVVETLRKIGPLPEEEVLRLLDLVNRGESGKILLSLGTRRHFEVSVSSRQDRSVLLFEDISERVATSERISFMARHDTLTALPNRSHFGDLVSADLAARPMGRGKIRTASLMIIDIDDFKHVNDTYGHLVGDRLLIEVSARLRQSVPSHAILARLGGDEFVIYRDAVRDTQQAEAEGQRVLDAFRTPFAIEGNMLNVGVSLGIATTTGANDTLDDLMTKADLALYSAKADGKAKTRMFHQQMDVDYHYRQRLKADLQAAIGEGALSLAFQPLLDIETRKVVSCEALARWTHPELGQIPPAVFIPLAEEIGLISEISAWVLKEATLQCAQWHPSVGVAVNISARDFRAIDLPALVDGALASAGLHASRLEIEVTETAVIEERDIARSALAALARRGVGIALDDFGTGYSSLSYLSALPFSKLKIDRSFVADIADQPRSLSLLANVARLGRDLDLIVVAEGVETEAQLETMIRHTAVQQVQGYLFSRPLPQRDIAELIGRLNGTALPAEKRKLG